MSNSVVSSVGSSRIDGTSSTNDCCRRRRASGQCRPARRPRRPRRRARRRRSRRSTHRRTARSRRRWRRHRRSACTGTLGAAQERARHLDGQRSSVRFDLGGQLGRHRGNGVRHRSRCRDLERGRSDRRLDRPGQRERLHRPGVLAPGPAERVVAVDAGNTGLGDRGNRLDDRFHAVRFGPSPTGCPSPTSVNRSPSTDAEVPGGRARRHRGRSRHRRRRTPSGPRRHTMNAATERMRNGSHADSVHDRLASSAA